MKSTRESQADLVSDVELKKQEAPSLLFSQRGVLAYVICFGMFTAYILRVNISTAVVCMVNATAVRVLATKGEGGSGNHTHVPNECGTHLDTVLNPDEDGEFVWPKQDQGLLLSSFFWGYVLMHLPGGWLATRLGSKRVYGLGMFSCIVLAGITPFAAMWSYWALLALRIAQGLGTGVIFPAAYALWAAWAPPLERSTLVSISFMGTTLASVFTFPVAGGICHTLGWEAIFYIFGGIGLVWFLLWQFLVYDTPEQNPRISLAEKNYIHSALAKAQGGSEAKPPVPWVPILTSIRVWAIFIAHFSNNYGLYTLITNLPAFMKEVLGFDIKSNGLFSALPYLGLMLGTSISGPSADFIRRRGYLSTTNVRRLYNTVGVAVPGCLLMITARLGCDVTTAMACLVLSQFLTGFRTGGYLCSHLDMAPKHAGMLFAMSNVGGTMAGIIAPYVIGLIVKEQSHAEWRTVFDITGSVMTAGSLFYLIFISGEVQDWAVQTGGVKAASEQKFEMTGVTAVTTINNVQGNLQPEKGGIPEDNLGFSENEKVNG